MAYRDHPAVELRDGDTVVFSATPIPGNERAVNETIDRLYHVGCDVVTAARRADPRLRPRLRGGAQADAQPHAPALRDAGPRRLQAAAAARQLAEAVGVPAENIFRSRTACRWRSTRKGARFGEPRRPPAWSSSTASTSATSPTSPCATAACSSADGIFIIVATVSEQDGSRVVAARGAGPRRAVHRRATPLRRRAARGGRGLARPRRRAADDRDRRARVDAPRRPRRASSTTASSGARWCCRSSSRSERA